MPEAYALTVAKLEAADTTTRRLLKKAEAAFKLMPESIPMIDHFFAGRLAH